MARTQPADESIDLSENDKNVPDTVHEEESQPPKLSSVGFFEQLSRFSTADWEQHIVYIYRLAPITDRLAGGTTKYLMKYGSRFDQDTVKSDHGSGRYRLQLNRSGEKGQSKTIRTHELDIEDIAFPPKVPPGEWLDDPRNKRWAWAKKKEEPAAAAGEAWTPERITRMVKELRPDAPPADQMNITKAVLDAVKETRAELGAANNPSSTIGMLKELILLTRPEPASKPEGEMSHFAMLMQMFQASEKRAERLAEDAKEERKRADEDRKRSHELELAERKHQHEKDLEMIKQRANQADPLTMVEQVLNLKAKLGGDEPDSRNWKEKLVDEGMQYVPQLLDLGKSIAQGYQRKAAPGQPPASNQTQPPQRPPQQPAPPPVATQTQAPPPGDPPVPEQTPVDPEVSWLADQFTLYGPHFVEAFRKDPNSGGDVGEMLMQFKPGIHERIARMGAAKIVEAIACLPEMMKDLLASGTPPMLEDFIKDFIDPPEPEDDPDDNLAPAVPISSKKPRAPKEVKP